MKRYEDTSAFILGGGASSRMGRDKGLLNIGGQPLVVRIARLVEPLVSSVTVVGMPQRFSGGLPFETQGKQVPARPAGGQPAPDDTFGLCVIADREFRHPEEGRTLGPLAGIATALAATGTAWNLILACDLPYLTREWVAWLLARAAATRQRIVIPRTRRGPEPLAAVYHRDCADPIAALLTRGVRKVVEAIAQFEVEFVFEREWQDIDPAGRVLRNMNTPADYQEARALFEKE